MTATLITLYLGYIVYQNQIHGRVDDAHLTVLGLLVGWAMIKRLAQALESHWPTLPDKVK